jgi:ABC-type Na+ transport system ATPase subunit NatA
MPIFYGFRQFIDISTLPPLSDDLKIIGTKFYTAWRSDTSGMVLLFISLGSVPIFLILAWYFNQALPNEEGWSLPWNFPFTKSFWTGRPQTAKTVVDGDVIETLRVESDRDQSVRIHKLTKIYKTTTAVKELSLTMEKGNVYALLGMIPFSYFTGHNGSGKSSTINCFSGVTVPTYGDAFLFGFNCRTEINSIRERMGVCSQFDFLYPSLSGAQHILLLATFRSVTPKQGLKAYIAEKLDLVGLKADGDKAAGSYSGGMKRRLSVASATVGNKLDIIFLDGEFSKLRML